MTSKISPEDNLKIHIYICIYVYIIMTSQKERVLWGMGIRSSRTNIGNLSRYTPWSTHEIRELIHDRNIAQKEANKNGVTGDMNRARQLRKLVNSRIQEAKEQFVKDALEESHDNQKKFWRNLNTLLGNTKSGTTDITLTTDIGEEVPTEEGADYLNGYFANIGKKLSEGLPDINQVVRDVPQQYIECDETSLYITERMVLHFVKEIDVNKSSGINTIPTFILKDCFMAMIPELVNLFNCSIETGIFLDAWAIANITPIPKSGN